MISILTPPKAWNVAFFSCISRISCSSLSSSMPNAPAKWIMLVENQLCHADDVGSPGNAGMNLSVDDLHGALKDGAHDALLPPDIARPEFAVFYQASQLGAGPAAAR